MKKEIITSTDPKSPVSEVFRTLRTNLQYLNKKNGAQTILLTSTLQGEGKSFVAANLAVTFAQAKKRTIIVDTDMRKPRQHKLFNSDMYPGLSNYLAGVNINRGSHKINIRECIYNTQVENLSILPAGNIPPNPSELLQSEKLGQLIKLLKNEYDVVVFDGAPCLLVTDATLVSRLVDATVLVISQGKTKVDDLKEVKNRIRRVGGRVAGVVLNRIKISGKRYGEKYYYYSNDSLQDRTRRRKEAEEDYEDKNKRKKSDKLEYKGNKHSQEIVEETQDEKRENSDEDNIFKSISSAIHKNEVKVFNENDNTEEKEHDKKNKDNDKEQEDFSKNNEDIDISKNDISEYNENENNAGSKKVEKILAEIKKMKEDIE